MRDAILALCVLSIVANAQEDPFTWFPLRVGSRWIYEHERKSGDRNRPSIDRWTTEETVTAWVTIPEGIVVVRDLHESANADDRSATRQIMAPNGSVRDVTERGNSHGGYLVARSRDPYLVRGSCVYTIGNGWDGQKQDLRPEFRKELVQGAVSPDFCFPLQNGREWGTTDIPWRVEPAREGVRAFLPAQFPEAIHIYSNHFGSGGSEDVWFQKGIGIVGVHYIHNGTYDEYSEKLVSFSH